MGMCFNATYNAWSPFNGLPEITRDLYLDSLLVHVQRVRHPEDISSRIRTAGVWVGYFIEVALKNNYEPLGGTFEWKTLLESIMDGDHASFRSSTEKFEPSRPPSPLQPAACLAAQNSHHEILGHCFRLDAKMDSTLTWCCRNGARTFGMMQVLHEADWESIRTSTKAAKGEVGW